MHSSMTNRHASSDFNSMQYDLKRIHYLITSTRLFFLFTATGKLELLRLFRPRPLIIWFHTCMLLAYNSNAIFPSGRERTSPTLVRRDPHQQQDKGPKATLAPGDGWPKLLATLPEYVLVQQHWWACWLEKAARWTTWVEGWAR